ncbi:MAG: hypothetical protein M3P45_10145 [Acidobacteriota bacterium]|nr:hypothetical protein [Acidobacteriota bacterium]
MKNTTVTAVLAITAEADTNKLFRPGRHLGGARFFEFHDQAWFPKNIRDGVTDALQFIFSLGGVYRSIVPRLNQAIEMCGTERVVDLCSGGGGPWLWLYRYVGRTNGHAVTVCLTDKYPNISAFDSARKKAPGQILFYPQRVEAANLPADLSGFRTIFTSFHHFAPDEAVAILQNAVDSGQGIGVFEAPRRHPLTILSTALMLLAGFVVPPLMRPFSISRLLWTYVIPVIPLVLFFDGVVSCLRAYSQEELRQLVRQVKSENYVWQIGEQTGGFTPITFLIGIPVAPRADTGQSISPLTQSR